MRKGPPRSGLPGYSILEYTKQQFLLSVGEILGCLGTDRDAGLSGSQLHRHREKYGETGSKEMVAVSGGMRPSASRSQTPWC